MREFAARVAALFRRGRLDRELDDEIRAHLEMLAEDYRRQGMPAEEARYAARRSFGGIEPMKEHYRDRRGIQMIETLWQDVRYAARTLGKTPGFTLATVLSLALGIGANTAVFTLLNAVMLRTLPVAEPRELVILEGRHRGGSGLVSFPMYRELRVRQQVFTDMLATAGKTPVRLTVPGASEIDNVRVSFVTGNYFSLLGLRPALGRFFTEQEDRYAASSETQGSVAVLSDAFWERQFGRDPGVLGRTVVVTRSPCRIVGVAPRGFAGEALGGAPDLWVPLISFSSVDELESRRAFTSYMARLKPGVRREQAEAAMTVLYRQLVDAENAGPVMALTDYSIELLPGATGLDYFLRRTFSKPLRIIMGVVALVLVIACANVANLLLARAARRRRETTIRLAIGCGRRRLVRQLLTESALLAGLGALAGLAVAQWGSRALLGIVAVGSLPVPLDTTVLVFIVTVTVLTALGFGLAPAMRASRVDLAPALNDQARGGTGRRISQRLSRTLVAAQVALSLLLLIGAALLLQSLRNLHAVELGFRPDRVLIFGLGHNARNREPEAMAEVARQVYERVQRLPGIESASLSGQLLFSPSDASAPLRIRDSAPSQEQPATARFNSVSPDYFRTIGMTLVEGRDFGSQDAYDAPHVAVVNESMARLYLPGVSPLGRVMEIGAGPAKGKPIRIVGVVRDAKYNNIRAAVKPMFYMPLEQLPRSLRSLEVRTAQPAAALVEPVRRALLEVTREIMVRGVQTLESQVDRTLAGERMIATLSSFFGGLALLLASIGLYAVMSYGVAQRTGEIGIRMALGASRSAVLWMVLRQSAAVMLVGAVLGLALALAATRLVSSFLYGLTPTDPAAIAAASTLLLAVAALAAYIPARRATRIDPLGALRYE